MRLPRSKKQRRRGSATLEFGVLHPMLIMVMLLAVDFGRFAHSYIAVNNAARAGASIGSFHPVTPASKPLWDAAIRQAVEDELESNAWFDATKLTTVSSIIDEADGSRRARVDVTYPFETLVSWPFLPGYNDPVNLRKVVVMRLVR